MPLQGNSAHLATGVGKNTPTPQPETAWLACLLCPALAWSGLGLPCLPCLGLVQQQQQRRRSRRRPPKAAGCCCWQGRQDRPRPDQAKAGHNRQASQAKAGGVYYCNLGLPGGRGGFIIATPGMRALPVAIINTPGPPQGPQGRNNKTPPLPPYFPIIPTPLLIQPSG